MSDIYYHKITKDFLKAIKGPELQLSDQLSLVIETDMYFLHLEFNHACATIGYILKDVSVSRAPQWYSLLTGRVLNMPMDVLNIGLSILNDSSIVVHTIIPNDLITTDRLFLFYELVDKQLLTEFSN